MEGLTVGRNVHYVIHDGQHFAAIVTAVLDRDMGVIDVVVFPPSNAAALPATFAVEPARYSEGKEPGTWHWIERA